MDKFDKSVQYILESKKIPKKMGWMLVVKFPINYSDKNFIAYYKLTPVKDMSIKNNNIFKKIKKDKDNITSWEGSYGYIEYDDHYETKDYVVRFYQGSKAGLQGWLIDLKNSEADTYDFQEEPEEFPTPEVKRDWEEFVAEL